MSISLEKVSYIYEDNSDIKKPALIKIDLEIGEGEFIGIIGHTGSGKYADPASERSHGTYKRKGVF